jgi:hypothetical protein
VHRRREAFGTLAELFPDHRFSLPTTASPAMARPKKHYGQHFLHERGVIERIVAAIAPQPDDRIVEIGPGEGALTLPLL